MNKRNLFAFVITMASSILILQACSKDSDSNSGSSTTARSYQGAGSRWMISLTDSTFSLTKYSSITDTTADLTLSGTVTRNAENEFLTMTVTSSSDTAEVPVNTEVTALEIPNTGVFIKTPDNATPLVAVVGGSCPTSEINSNWVITKPRLESGDFEPASLDDDGSGTARFNPSAEEFQVISAGIVNRQFDETGSTAFDISGQDCESGMLAATLTLPGPVTDVFDMYFTSSGFQIVKFPAATGDQIIFGLPKQSTAVTAASIAGTYSIMLYEGGASLNLSDATLEPARMVIATNGAATIRKITDVGADTLAGSDAYTIGSFSTTFTSNGSALDNDGSFHGEFASGENVTCSLANSSGTRVIACYGFTGSGASRRPVTIIGHSR
jgi:hypothetical protein